MKIRAYMVKYVQLHKFANRQYLPSEAKSTSTDMREYFCMFNIYYIIFDGRLTTDIDYFLVPTK